MANILRFFGNIINTQKDVPIWNNVLLIYIYLNMIIKCWLDLYENRASTQLINTDSSISAPYFASNLQLVKRSAAAKGLKNTEPNDAPTTPMRQYGCLRPSKTHTNIWQQP